MADITSNLDAALQKHEAHLKHSRRKRSQTADEFLKEAYRLEGNIASLNTYLRSIRPPYLSTSLPSRRTPLSRANSSTSERVNPHHHQSNKDRRYFTDTQRDQIDAECKATLQKLNTGIGQLQEAEKLRQDTLTSLANKKHSRNGFRALGRWAAGEVGVSNSPEEALEDAQQKTIKLHRESVIWYLKRKMEEAVEIQSGMMQTRLDREIEKSKSMLYKTKGASGATMGNMEYGAMNGSGDGNGNAWSGGGTYSRAAVVDDMDRKKIEQQLSPEQLQLFEKENNDMLKHYENALDQVRTAERSMYEISEMQNTLAQNLDIQSANIDQLAMDSIDTSENVGGGNKQLKRATERKSTARMVFYASCGLSAFLVIWDLVF